MRIPLRLAITGQVEEGREASAEAQQPWSIRLAGRLLCMLSEGAPGPSAGTPGAYAAAGSAPLQCQAEKEEEGDVEEGAAAGDGEALLCGPSVAGRSIAALQAGSASPWQPYLAVLPDCVPSPLTTFSWEDVQAIEVGPRGRGAGGGGGGAGAGAAGCSGQRKRQVLSPQADGRQVAEAGTRVACTPRSQTARPPSDPDPPPPSCSTLPCARPWTTPAGWPRQRRSSPAEAASPASSGSGRCRCAWGPGRDQGGPQSCCLHRLHPCCWCRWHPAAQSHCPIPPAKEHLKIGFDIDRSMHASGDSLGRRRLL